MMAVLLYNLLPLKREGDTCLAQNRNAETETLFLVVQMIIQLITDPLVTPLEDSGVVGVAVAIDDE